MLSYKNIRSTSRLLFNDSAVNSYANALLISVTKIQDSVSLPFYLNILVIVHTKSAPASILYVKGIKFLEKFHCVEGNYYLTYELKFYIFL